MKATWSSYSKSVDWLRSYGTMAFWKFKNELSVWTWLFALLSTTSYIYYYTSTNANWFRKSWYRSVRRSFYSVHTDMINRFPQNFKQTYDTAEKLYWAPKSQQVSEKCNLTYLQPIFTDNTMRNSNSSCSMYLLQAISIQEPKPCTARWELPKASMIIKEDDGWH